MALDLSYQYESVSVINKRIYSSLLGLESQSAHEHGECFKLPYSLKYINVSHSSLLCNSMFNICNSNNSLTSLNASYQIHIECFDNFWNSLENLPMLEELDLSGNRLKLVPYKAFFQQRHLKYLSLSHNVLLINSFDIQSFKLNFLDLSDNAVRYLSTQFLDTIETIQVDSNLVIYLSNNPLVCDCDRMKFVAWLRNTRAIYEKDELKCKYENGTDSQLTNIIAIHRSLEMECIVFEVTVACVVGFIALNILLSLAALIWHKRWQIRYLLSIARRNVNPYHPLEEQEIVLEYDVYISYERDFSVTLNESLHEFVTLNVYPALQRRGFRVLIRDELNIGMKLYQVISRAIRRSKHVLVFLSRDYCIDYWNVFEFNLAVIEGIYTKRQVVIPVTFETLRRSDLHDEVYAFLNAEPVPRYKPDMNRNNFIDYLCERLMDDSHLD